MKENNNEPSFPGSVSYSFEYQKEHFQRCRYTSSEVTKLYCKIVLPLDVKPVSIKPELIAGTNKLYATGCYKTISEAKYPFTEVDIVYEHINNDIDTSGWGKHILGLLGEKILYCKYYSTFE